MVKISKFDSNLSDTFNCNALAIKNNGTSEAEITFLSSGDTLSVQRGTIVYVFNSSTLVTDTYSVSFTSIGTTNEIEVIQTTYSNTPSPTNAALSRIEERNVYVNVIPDIGFNRYDISKYLSGTSGISYAYGALFIQGSYVVETGNTIVALQTKNCAPNVEGSVYGGWIDLNYIQGGGNSNTKFGIGTLDPIPEHDVSEGIYFDISAVSQNIIIKNASLGIIYLQPRNNWYDDLSGTGPSGVVYDFTSSRGIFYFEYIYSGNLVNIYLSYNGQEILVDSYVNNNYMSILDNPRQQMFLRAKCSNEGDDFNIGFRGCSIYNCSNSIVPRKIGLSSLTFQVGAEKYSSGSTGYLGMVLRRVQTGNGYRFLRLKNFQVSSEDNHAYSLLLVINPTIQSNLIPPSLLPYGSPWGSYGSDEAVSYATNYDGSFEITSYDLCVDISQHLQYSDTVNVVNQFLGNEINGSAQEIAIMIIPQSNNMHFRVTANVEEL